MSKSWSQWERHPALVSIVEQIAQAMERGDWATTQRLSGHFISKAQELGMPLKLASCCGFRVVEGTETICPDCQDALDSIG